MDTSRLRFPRLSLARSGATHLAIFGTYASTEERLALLPERPKRTPEGRTGLAVFSFPKYKTRGAASASYIIAATSHSDDDSREIHVSISYRISPEGARSRRLVGVPEGELLEIVQALGAPDEVGGLVTFQFDNREPNQLWFPLPVSLAGKSPEDVIEVRGVRGTKLGAQDAEPEYEFILDRPEHERVILQIELNLEGTITAESVRLLFNRAEAIARELVTNT